MRSKDRKNISYNLWLTPKGFKIDNQQLSSLTGESSTTILNGVGFK